jgi:hypothetical protein
MPDKTSRPDTPDPDAPSVEPGVIIIAKRRYLTRPKLARDIKKSERTLQRWDEQGIGPARIQVGAMVLYEEAGLPDWLASHRRKPTRQPRRRRGGGDARATA